MGGHATSQARQHASETIDKIKAALIAFGTVKAKDFLASAIPGLEQHLEGLVGSTGRYGQSQPSGGAGTSGSYGGGSQYEGNTGPTSGSAHNPAYSGAGGGTGTSGGASGENRTGGPSGNTGMGM